MKKALSLFLVLLVMLGSAPLGGFVGLKLPSLSFYSKAASADDLEFTLSDSQDSYSVSAGSTQISGNLVIPSLYNGRPVTSIGGDAFYECTGLESVTIPDSVTSIYDKAFYGCTGLTSVTIPDSVTSIGERAFSGCTGLTSVTIPDSVTSISKCAFYNCTGITSVTIPGNVKSIGVCAFSGCNRLTSVTISDGVVSIGVCAFYECTGLTFVTIPDSVTSIGEDAFPSSTRLFCNSSLESWVKGTGNTYVLLDAPYDKNYISGQYGKISYTVDKLKATLTLNYAGTVPVFSSGERLPWIGYYKYIDTVKLSEDATSISKDLFPSRMRYVSLPNTLTSIGYRAFYGYDWLTSVTIPDSVTSIGYEAFSGCTGLKSVTIPDSVTSIGNDAFNGCTGLTSVTIPDSVTSISAGAFNGCTGLTSVTIPDSVTSISWYAFYNCTGLTSVTIPDSVTSISDYAFYDCTGLESVTIPDSVTSIGYKAFCGCTGLKSVYINDVAAWCKIVFAHYSYGDTDYSSNPLYYAHNLYLNGELVSDLVIPDGVTSIGDYAFYNCTGLRSVTIPDSVTSIGERAFYGCTGLESVNIPDSVTSIDWQAFYDCTGLKSVYINDVAAWCRISFYHDYSNPLYYAHNLYINGELVSDLVIPDGVTSISNYAFYKCTGLTSVTIPNSVTSIGASAFSYCTGLTSVTIPGNVKSIGERAFSGCTGLTSVTIPDSVRSIGVYAFPSSTRLFCNSSLNSVVKGTGNTYVLLDAPYEENHISGQYGKISYTVDKLKATLTLNYAGTVPDFSSGESLPWKEYDNYIDTVIISEGTTSIAGGIFPSRVRYVSLPNTLTSIGDNAFYDCTRLTSVTIPDSVTSIGVSAFRNCTGLESVTIPDSVTSIGDYAFYKCAGLRSVTIPDSVTSIGVSAFSNCTGLESVTIPDSVTSIGVSAFRNCTGLESVTIPDSVTSISEDAFRYCTGLESVTIPDSVTSIGRHAFLYCTGLTSVIIPFSVTSIGEGSFSACSNLSEVTVYNPDLDISKIGLQSTVSICAPSGSKAQEYAESTGRLFIVHNHTAGEWIIDKEATCTSVGKKHHVCSVCKCDFDITDIPIDSTNHDYSAEWTIDMPATCATEGSKSHHCTRCDAKTDITIIPIDPTNHNYSADVTDPTCTEQGYTTYTCSACGDSYIDDYVPALGHTDIDENGFCDRCHVLIGSVTGLRQSNHGSDFISLSWNAVKGAKGYEIQQIINGEWKKIATVSSPTAKITKLEPGASYDFKVRAYAGSVTGGYSDVVSAHTGPSAMTGKVSVNRQDSEMIRLQWNKINNADGYMIYWYVNGKLTKLAATLNTAYTIANLNPDTKYTFKVRGYRKVGNAIYVGGYSADFVTWTGPKPTTGTAVAKTKSATLSWDAVEGATKYYIYVYTAATGYYTCVCSTTATSKTITGLTTGQAYYYRVKACKVNDGVNYYSSYSNVMFARAK